MQHDPGTLVERHLTDVHVEHDTQDGLPERQFQEGPVADEQVRRLEVTQGQQRDQE